MSTDDNHSKTRRPMGLGTIVSREGPPPGHERAASPEILRAVEEQDAARYETMQRLKEARLARDAAATQTPATTVKSKPVKRAVIVRHPDDDDGSMDDGTEELRPIDELIRSVRVRAGRGDDERDDEIIAGDDDEVELDDEDEDKDDVAPEEDAEESVETPDAVADAAPVVEETKPEETLVPAKKTRTKKAKVEKAAPVEAAAVATPAKKAALPPSARVPFSKARGELPKRFDTGDFVITLNNGKGHAALINHTNVGITESEYGIVIDLFNARGAALTSTQLGDKYYPDHDRPTGTVASSIFKIRAAFKKAAVECHESMITTVKGKGFQYTGPNAPAVA